jgi:hypothetical protein
MGPRTVRWEEAGHAIDSVQNVWGDKISTADCPSPTRGLSASRVFAQVRLDQRGTVPTYPLMKATGSSLSHLWKKKAIGGEGPWDWRHPRHSVKFPGHSVRSSIMSTRYFNVFFSDLDGFEFEWHLGLILDLFFEPWIWETNWG